MTRCIQTLIKLPIVTHCQTKDIPGLPWIDFNSIEQNYLCASKFDLVFPEEDFLII